MRRTPVTLRGLATALCLLLPAAGRAQEEGERPAEPLANRTEFGFIPLVGGDSDFGVAVGTLGSVAHFGPGARPYAWRLELNGMLSFAHPEGRWVNPFQDYYVKLTVPSLLGNRLRLAVRGAFTAYGTLRYFGVGNASVAMRRDDPASQYRLSYPHATVEMGLQLAGAWRLSLAADYLYESTLVYPDSKLAHDLDAAPDLVVGAGNYHVAVLSAGLHYDSRDDEVAPARGVHHSLAVRLSPGRLLATPYQFGGLYAALRAYLPLAGPTLVLAMRAVGDVLHGAVPFYMLAESLDGYALGGINGVRGVPAQRYYGKLKAYSSAELRLTFPAFAAFDQEMAIGLVAFGDAGRLWAEARARPDLDGTGLGLHYGAGAGLRVQLGKTFLLRGDCAWSPDAHPVALYFNAGHAF